MNIKGDISISGGRKSLKRPTPLKPEVFKRLFAVLEDAAVKGERCPQLQELTDKHKIPASYRLSLLADAGWIRMEIYSRNWRVVEINTGPNKGARTQESPKGGKPYKVFDNPAARAI